MPPGRKSNSRGRAAHASLGFALLAGWALCGRPAPATTLTGLLIYAADDFGNPSGLDWDTGRITTGQIWRTAAHPQFGLGVAPGGPPASIARDLLNQPDMSIAIDLAEGVSEFTFFAQWGPGTDLDERYVLSCFFDGEEQRPGASVLFPLRPTGGAPAPQPLRSDVHLTFNAEVQSGTPDPTFSTDSEVVSVATVHFLPPDAVGEVDKVAQHAPASGDGADLVGVLTLVVQPVDASAPEPVLGEHGMQGFRGGVTFGTTAQVGPDQQGAPGTGGDMPLPVPARPSDHPSTGAGDAQGTFPPSPTVRSTLSTPTARATRSPGASPTAGGTTTPGQTPMKAAPTMAASPLATRTNRDTQRPSVRPTAAPDVGF